MNSKIKVNAAVRLQASGDMVAYQSAIAVDKGFTIETERCFGRPTPYHVVGKTSHFRYSTWDSREEAEAEIQRLLNKIENTHQAATRLSAALGAKGEKELIQLLSSKLQKIKHDIKAMEPEKENSSVRSNYYTLVGKVEAIEAVLDAMRGSSNNLKML